MKKQFKTPKIKVVNMSSTSIICASGASTLSFGDGFTDTMHAKGMSFWTR